MRQNWPNRDAGALALAACSAMAPIASGQVAMQDFNGDGFADLAIPVPGESVTGHAGAGAVNVIYGSSAGLTPDGNQFWHQDAGEILDDPESNDQFGRALAHGDFNNDGFSDLAIGVPLEDIGAVQDAGAVNVLYGSAAGLDAAANQFWHQDSPAVKEKAELSDFFGGALASGDFNGDGFYDLAIGVHGESVGGKPAAGAVNLLYGSAAGLSATNNKVWHQDSAGMPNKAEKNDWFGRTLTAADFDGNGFDDLAIGVPQEGLNGKKKAGSAHVLYGGPNGLTADNDDFWNQDSSNIFDTAEAFDQFAHALCSGDFDGDGFADLAIGVPYENFAGTADAGLAHVLYGGAGGLHWSGSQVWHQGITGVQDVPEASDWFGFSLGADDFSGDGRDDLIIGAAGELDQTGQEAGLVHVLFGVAAGLSASGSQSYTQSAMGITKDKNPQDGFGSWIGSGKFAGGNPAGLAVGAGLADFGTVQGAGEVAVIHGVSPGGVISAVYLWSQESDGILDDAEDGDGFGAGPYF